MLLSLEARVQLRDMFEKELENPVNLKLLAKP
jgi:hypothetical protein